MMMLEIVSSHPVALVPGQASGEVSWWTRFQPRFQTLAPISPRRADFSSIVRLSLSLVQTPSPQAVLAVPALDRASRNSLAPHKPNKLATMSTTSSTAPPATATSSPATNNTSSDTIPVLPGAAPAYSTTNNATYANITIDDFSPILTFSNNTGAALKGDWVTPLTDSDLSAARPLPEREWYLGTYMRTETVNASISFVFEGSELHLYGDRGPAYGAYSIEVDDGTPELKSAFYPALAVGPAHYLASVRNLTEGNHTVRIVNWGTREGLVEGKSFLLDYVVVRQKVGPVDGQSEPKISDVTGEDLASLNTTGTWTLVSNPDDVFTAQGLNASQPKVWYETTERRAQLGYEFTNATAIQVYGTRNGTHGAYTASLSSSNNPSFAPITNTYNASVPCGLTSSNTTTPALNSPENVLPGCEWDGTVLMYSSANLDPTSHYALTLENVDEDGGVLGVGLIRTLGLAGEQVEAGSFPQSLTGGGGGTGTNGGTGNNGDSGDAGQNGALRVGMGMFELVIMVLAWMFVWRSVFGRHI
ncbi:hypothetical protein NMY22_g10311 [Coprinellus aureogranulatus]|nr:hypothetical protein NMY22_g10311 [Coprinellus aureogranulatus]